MPGDVLPGVTVVSGVTPGAASGVGFGVLQGVCEVAALPDSVPAQGGWVPGVVLALLEPAAPGVAAVPGVAVVPGEVAVPGVLVLTVPGVVGGGVVGIAVDGVDWPGVVVCGDVLMPLVLVLPLAPGLAVPGCEVRAPAPPEVCSGKAAATRIGDAWYKEEDGAAGLAEGHLSATFRRCRTWKAVVLELIESLAEPLLAPTALPAAG